MDRRGQAWAPRLLHELERCQFEGKTRLNKVKRKGLERFEKHICIGPVMSLCNRDGAH